MSFVMAADSGASSAANADAKIDTLGSRRTLCPGRERATTLCELSAAAPSALRPAFDRCLARIAFAQVEAFPENIFWDFDALAWSLLDQALAAETHGEALLDELGQQVAALQGLFGAGSAIRFRYVHDFTYGYDWSKWVRRGPEERASHAPFGQTFIDYSTQRGHELLDLIAANDIKYPKLNAGEPRNPFGFSRTHDDEVRLFEHLAASDLLPLRAWEPHPVGRWDRDYRELRNAEAIKLGL